MQLRVLLLHCATEKKMTKSNADKLFTLCSVASPQQTNKQNWNVLMLQGIVNRSEQHEGQRPRIYIKDRMERGKNGEYGEIKER